MGVFRIENEKIVLCPVSDAEKELLKCEVLFENLYQREDLPPDECGEDYCVVLAKVTPP